MAEVRWSFLEAWTSELAWWFGVFLGDGCAPAKGETLQCTGSESTTRRWGALVVSSPAGRREYRQAPGTYLVYVCSRALSDWMLHTHGYRGPKSKDLRWPVDLPPACLSHFIRGLWDADGCIYVQDKARRTTTGNPMRSLVYTSIAVPFVERLGQEIERAVGIPIPKLNMTVVPQTGNPRAQLHYTGASAQKLADWLYADAPEHIRNEDRFEMYRRMCALREQLAQPCVCGVEEQYSDGLCRTCWEAKQPRTTGPGTQCATGGCSRPVWSNGLCNACRKRQARAEGRYKPELKGACACGSPSYRTDGLCVACAARRKRGVPTRFELEMPATGWKSRAGEKLSGRPRT